jgi:hypothetical protein
LRFSNFDTIKDHVSSSSSDDGGDIGEGDIDEDCGLSFTCPSQVRQNP